MPKKPAISLIVAVVLIAPLTVFALVNWIERKWAVLPVYTTPQKTIAGFSLTNQHGQTVSKEQWTDNIVVANFFFTHCPVICPKMVANIKKVKDAFPDNQELLFNSFTVDPVRDSVPQLQRYAYRFGIEGNWHLLTGNKMVIYNLARCSLAVTADEGDGGEHDFIHSEKLVLIDPEQKIRGYFNGTSATDIHQLIQAIKKLQDEK
jgi:protein SCO1/2